MQRLFPLIDSLKSYNKTKLRQDLTAGLVVGVMLIPQGMAYAMIAGLPPVYGLYTAILPTILYAIFGTSRHVSVGPVAMDSLILFAGVSTIAIVGTENYIAVVIALTTIVGVIQLAMGVFRLGFIANFLSKPVILGFTFAAATIISIKQIKYLTRIDTGAVLNVFEEFGLLITHVGDLHLPTFILAIVALAALILGKKFVPRFPMSLTVVLVGTAFSYFLTFEELGIDLVGTMPSGLPMFALPDWGALPFNEIIPLAFTLALMGFVEIYSIGQRLQSKHKGDYEIDPNRELIGLGLGNIMGSFFRTFPATAGFSRSAVNEGAGAQTNIAAFVSVAVVILALLFLMPVFRFLPEALLGAIIFIAVLGLIDVNVTKNLWHNDRYDFAMLVSSFAGTLILGIAWGIGVGILLSLLVLIYKASTPHMAVLGQVQGTNYFRNLDRFDAAIDDPTISILRFDARLFFANAGSLKSKIEALVRQKPTMNKMVLDAQSINDIDSSGLDVLEDIIGSLNDRNIQFHMVNIIGPVRDKLFLSGLADKIGLGQIHDCIEDAIIDNTDKTKLAYQTNVK